MKRLLGIAAVLLLPVAARALTLAVETRPAAPGNQTTVGIYIQDARQLGHLTFQANYDWQQLELLEARAAPAVAQATPEILVATSPEIFPDQSGAFRFSMVAAHGFSGTGQLVELVFALADTLPEFLELSLGQVSAVDTALQELPVTLENGGLALITAVEEEQQALPPAPALHPNFPNPFNRGTTIPFELAAPAAVRLRIYNLLGQVVRDFDLGQLPAGYYTGNSAVRWDGRDRQGRETGTGIYLIRLEADEFVEVRKALLLK